MTSAQHPEIPFKLPFHPYPPLLFFFSVSVIKSNRGDISPFSFPLCATVSSSASAKGEQGEVDLCVYISVVPPPYCGIDVALWCLGLKRHREAKEGEAKKKRDEFS